MEGGKSGREEREGEKVECRARERCTAHGKISNSSHQFQLLGALGGFEADDNMGNGLAVAAQRVFGFFGSQLGHLVEESG